MPQMKHKRLNRDGWGFQYYPYYQMRAFNGCKKLGKVKIQSTKLRSIGKQAFKGTKSSLKVKVPSKQLEKYKKILKKAGLKVKQVTK